MWVNTFVKIFALSHSVILYHVRLVVLSGLRVEPPLNQVTKKEPLDDENFVASKI